jgi:predicted  nucleic acid-binding Zn-ribbon protein
MKQEWEAEKRNFERELQENHEGQSAIISQIEESKTHVAKMERKIKEIEGQHRLV